MSSIIELERNFLSSYMSSMHCSHDLYCYHRFRVTESWYSKSMIVTRDVNDAELLMPSRDYWFLIPSRDFHFRGKKRAQAEPRL